MEDQNKNGINSGDNAQQYGVLPSAAARRRRTTVSESAYSVDGANGSSGSNDTNDSSSQNNPPKKKRKKDHPHLRRFGIVFCSICLIGIISVSSVGLYVLKYINDFVTGEVAVDLDECKANQSQTTILYTIDDDGNEIELIRLHGEENRIWVDLKDIPEYLQNAYIALEDQRFKKHQGVDWIRTIGVLVVPSNDGQGGSTITQQLIKNLTGERDVTYIRKFNEIKNALNLEKHYSKETILEAYLNTLYLDSGCYGVQTAAEYYFGKNVSDLNLAECVCIAAITKAPRAYNPILAFEDNQTRAHYALKCMLEQGLITQEEYDEAMAYDLVFTSDEDYVPSEDSDKNDEDGMIPVDENTVGEDGEEDEEEVQSYYIDFVIDKVISDLMKTYNYTKSEAWRLVYYGGLKIHVAVDLEIQSILEDVYYNRKGFPDVRNSYGEEVQSCMVIMDYSGRVVGIIGQAGEKEGARCLNIATDSMRQPGSSIKPLSVYSLAIDSKEYYWSSIIQNYGIIVDGSRWPNNFGHDPGSPTSYETIQQALAPSHNTVTAQLVQALGVRTSYEWLRDKFKITSLYEKDEGYSALAVGGMTHGIYPIEMCAAYCAFGNGGKYYEPYCYYTVTNSSGSTVYLTHNDDGEQIISPGTAGVMNKLLQTVVTSSNGTGRNYKIDGFESFAKTGTTSDEKDRWYVGATPYYCCTAWIGYAEHAEMLSFQANYLGEIYQAVMNRIHQNLPAKSFEFGDEIVQRAYCTISGNLAGPSCPSATGWYSADALPPTCSSHAGYYVSSSSSSDEPENNETPENNEEQNGGGNSGGGNSGGEQTTAAPPIVETTAAPPVVDDPPENNDPPAGGGDE